MLPVRSVTGRCVFLQRGTRFCARPCSQARQPSGPRPAVKPVRTKGWHDVVAVASRSIARSNVVVLAPSISETTRASEVFVCDDVRPDRSDANGDVAPRVTPLNCASRGYVNATQLSVVRALSEGNSNAGTAVLNSSERAIDDVGVLHQQAVSVIEPVGESASNVERVRATRLGEESHPRVAGAHEGHGSVPDAGPGKVQARVHRGSSNGTRRRTG